VGPVDEASPTDSDLLPGDLYARSKREAEEVVRGIEEKRGFPVTIVRPSAVYGERDRLMAPALRDLIELPLVPLFGPSRNALPVVYAGNVAVAIRLALEAARPATVYNVGLDHPLTQRELMEWLGAGLGTSPRFITLPAPIVRAAGEVLARSETGRFAAFDLDETYGADAKLVIAGCGEAFELGLPAPKDDVEDTFSADSERIELEVDGPLAGTFAKASTYAFSEGHVVACQTDTATSHVPVSDAYSFYRAAAFAFDEPVIVSNQQVHAELFPSAYAITAVSTQVDLGPLWDAAVAVAEESSLYEGCADACATATAACGDAAEDLTPCAVPCVAAGEATPDCRAEYQARVECASANATCESTAAPSAACEQADADWTACANE